jgi:hypothetical protein
MNTILSTGREGVRRPRAAGGDPAECAQRRAHVGRGTSINAPIKDIKRNPFNGLGKPEPLNTRCRAGGRAAFQASTAWSIVCPERAGISNS